MSGGFQPEKRRQRLRTNRKISEHYGHGGLLHRLYAALRAEGVDPQHPTVQTLAPYDQFHSRGLEATEELASSLAASPQHIVLDIGSGIGGPARYFADRFGCRVCGIDLTSEFCEVAQTLTAAVGLPEKVAFVCGNALQMPFADAAFDGAYCINVSMNIAEKINFYRGIWRLLRPGAWMAMAEIAQGPGGKPEYPTPWAPTAVTSFLATPAATLEDLTASGFRVERTRGTAREALAFAALSRAMVEQGSLPPHRAVQLIHGESASRMASNTQRGIAEERLLPIEILCRKPRSSP
jgi:ubiquinone/menaquinone biosynthesis C-methylase UbiE